MFSLIGFIVCICWYVFLYNTITDMRDTLKDISDKLDKRSEE